MKEKLSSLFSYVVVIAMALLLAVNYYVFIIENHFAPAGINGIATMIQYKTGFSISYMSLMINIPLCILSFFLIERKYAYRSLVFTLVYSFSYLYLQKSGLDVIQYNAGGHDTIFPAIISGVISGVVCGLCLRHSSSSGGMEFVSKYINKIRPDANFFMVTFVINTIVAFVSLIVYSDKGYLDYKPVALCITYCFVTNFVGNYIIQGAKQAFKFTIITTHPEEICEEVTHILKHSATKIEAQGAYSGASKTVLICVVNKHQLTAVQKLLKKYDNTFSFYETVGETYGNFKKIKQ
ncbi:MAG: YitT family protein [Ruminococcaceae bacterium]|nr:YitT family protein [Oscillospiraceae bacterium]